MDSRTSVRKAMEKVAAKEGITVEKVREEIELAMLAGLHSSDPQVRLRWQKIPCRGTVPVPEELIAYFSDCIAAQVDPFA